MATPPLTIRNLTSSSLELKMIERFEAAQHQAPSNNGKGIANITKVFSGLMNNITTPSSPQLALKSESFRTESVAITIGPFASKRTGIEPNQNEVLRLTFEVEGQRYRIDTPSPNQRSNVLTPLSPDPRFEFTGVYLPTSPHLALYSSARLESWMSKLKNETPLSALSIPGTHNAPAHYTALPSVRCQAVGVKEQLNNGIRFLDIRVQPETPDDVSKDGLILVHSAFPVSLTGNKYFRDLVKTVSEFLDANPTETVIISVKREGVGKATDQHLSKILHKHYANDPNRWFTENHIPTLGEARKRIVLIRRFAIDDSLKGENNGQGWAMDGESWPDNCADGLCSSGEIRVQDFYEVAESENIDKKISYSTDHLDRAAQVVCPLPGDMNAAAAEAAKLPFFINFLTASNFWRANCWPDRIAAKVNPSIIDFLCRRHNESAAGEGKMPTGDGSTGIVVCDWVGNNGDWDLVRCIVGMNAKLEQRK
ncbi:Phosphatidylinositol phospholipase-like protein C [Venustampulla echinocandica]|uniref:Phosphatidylinositol phospholipase-like protein C n=1 Tax=Venustampulla echinocandica TaxID=2656787 RepID=A0A370U3D0_9HELO|nr:Phosphatidylinositol phospholipase-like protein C [Venustampulla echinocandica]RDL42296.1 Phosphatidylinositol phospholipase-like protein C [Venustampulla echinocandica]